MSENIIVFFDGYYADSSYRYKAKLENTPGISDSGKSPEFAVKAVVKTAATFGHSDKVEDYTLVYRFKFY